MATNLFSPATVKLFGMAYENRHQFCPHDFAEKAQFLRNSREGFRGRWLVSGNRGQRSDSGKALPGVRAGAACAKSNPKFATQHPRRSGDATLARLFGKGNCAREGPAQSSEPEKHRSKFIARRTTTRSLTGGAWDA